MSGQGNEASCVATVTPRERELLEAGWTRQFTADEPRLSEAVELYESLGYEVCLEPLVRNETSQECQLCYEVACDRYKIIYTRRASRT